MAKRTWTDQEIELLKTQFPEASKDQLKKLFPSKTLTAIYGKAKVVGIRRKIKHYKYTPEIIDDLKKRYPHESAKQLAIKYGFSYSSVLNMAFKLGLKKDPYFIVEHNRKQMLNPNHPARKYCIKKGNIPSNKGKKQSEYMTPEQIKKTVNTQFKKGNRPANYRPIGSERTDKEGYVLIKSRNGLKGWDLKHRVIWEKHYGEIPAGANIQFKDGNKLNCEDINNLYMITKSDQLKYENSLHVRYPEEIKKIIQLKGALRRQINKIETKNK